MLCFCFNCLLIALLKCKCLITECQYNWLPVVFFASESKNNHNKPSFRIPSQKPRNGKRLGSAPTTREIVSIQTPVQPAGRTLVVSLTEPRAQHNIGRYWLRSFQIHPHIPVCTVYSAKYNH